LYSPLPSTSGFCQTLGVHYPPSSFILFPSQTWCPCTTTLAQLIWPAPTPLLDPWSPLPSLHPLSGPKPSSPARPKTLAHAPTLEHAHARRRRDRASPRSPPSRLGTARPPRLPRMLAPPRERHRGPTR
jgi:hypothetical protein